MIDRQVIKEFKLSSNREGFEQLEDELNSFRVVKTASAIGLAEAMSRNHFAPSFQEKSEYYVIYIESIKGTTMTMCVIRIPFIMNYSLLSRK
ncbi:MAG: hypothetical protein ABF536_08100 [Liquorilactobacillus mali]